MVRLKLAAGIVGSPPPKKSTAMVMASVPFGSSRTLRTSTRRGSAHCSRCNDRRAFPVPFPALGVLALRQDTDDAQAKHGDYVVHVLQD